MTEDKLEVGIGHPDFDRSQLSADDEKKVDAKGEPIVLGLPWGVAGTDIWLTVAGFRERDLEGVDEPFYREVTADINLGHRIRLAVCCTHGKPTFLVPYWGAALELPVDLGRDPLKKQYVTEWIVDTVKEVLMGSGGIIPGDLNHFKEWLEGSCDKLIKKAGL